MTITIDTIPRLRIPVLPMVLSAAACSGGIAPEDRVGGDSAELAGSSIASIAAHNLGKGPCDTNSAGGKGYHNSCNEAWCADFAAGRRRFMGYCRMAG